MQFLVVVRVLGLLVAIFSTTMLLPGLVSLAYGDGSHWSFFIGFAVTLLLGALAYLPLRNHQAPLKLRDGFVIVVMFWTVLGLFGAIPLYIDEKLNLTIAQSIFESLSGFTTTGATVIVGLDSLPEGILLYRQLVQWLGGMGIIALRSYSEDSEFRFYISLLILLSLITVGYLYLTQTVGFDKSLFDGIFQVVSIATTTGFTTAEYFNWPGFLPVLLLFASFVGGCAGSTGGGMKVIRVLLLLKQGLRELARMVHPHAVLPVKVGQKTIPSRVIDAVWGFFATYVLVLALMSSDR